MITLCNKIKLSENVLNHSVKKLLISDCNLWDIKHQIGSSSKSCYNGQNARDLGALKKGNFKEVAET